MKKLKVFGLLLLLLLQGCRAVSTTLEPTETTQIQPFVTATATTDWFPTTPTHTPTPVATLEPTLNMKPGLGAVIYRDDFSDRSLWVTGLSQNGSIAYGKNELTLAISQSGKALIAQPVNLVLQDFSLELTANPSLCAENDVYGVLFRVNSLYDYYRLLVSCNGQVRMERVRQATTSILQDWVLTGQIPPGAPIRVRLGLWVSGSKIRFFANGSFLFEVEDSSFSSGGIGVYARSGGENALTVNYSDLIIQEVYPAAGKPTLTLTPASNASPQSTLTLLPTHGPLNPTRTP